VNWGKSRLLITARSLAQARNAGSYPEQRLIISVSLSGRGGQYFDPCKITLWGPVRLVFDRIAKIKIDSNKMTITLTLVSLVGYTLFYRRLGLRVLLTVCRTMFNDFSAVDKTRNMEHSGTFLNIPEHRIVIIIMRKICKMKF